MTGNPCCSPRTNSLRNRCGDLQRPLNTVGREVVVRMNRSRTVLSLPPILPLPLPGRHVSTYHTACLYTLDRLGVHENRPPSRHLASCSPLNVLCFNFYFSSTTMGGGPRDAKGSRPHSTVVKTAAATGQPLLGLVGGDHTRKLYAK